MKRFVIAMFSLFVAHFSGISQSDVDALRYSRTFIGGTSRFMSMGGAFGSLGADFSTASTNPAGLGLYSKSELTISPAMFVGRTDSDFNGNKTNDSQYNFNLGNAGIVVASPPKSDKGTILKNYQFAFGVNRSNNFNNRLLMVGYNDQNSIVDTYVDRSNGIYFGDIEDDHYGYYAYDLKPAWYTYMMDTLPGSTDQYYGAVPPGTGIEQWNEINTWGSMNEMVLSFGVNLADRVYFGATFGFPFLRYFRESYYTESDQDNHIDGFDKLIVYEDLTTHGSGFNLKFGTIIRVTDFLRLGGAIHSPTWFNNMNDEWYAEYTTFFDNNETYFERTPFGAYDYQLETPWKALGSLSLVLAGKALISAEYEYMDFAKSRLSSGGYSFYEENQNIRTKYLGTHTLRMGAEYRFGHLSVRGGGGYYSSPFADDINDGSKYFYSGGVGFRDESFFLDLAYIQTISKEDYYFYGSENVVFNPVENKYSTYTVMMTLGMRF
jgi:hypothetical protein